MGFGEASLFLKIALIAVAVGFLLHLIGFATSYWQAYEVGLYTVHSGLWSYDSGYTLPKIDIRKRRSDGECEGEVREHDPEKERERERERPENDEEENKSRSQKVIVHHHHVPRKPVHEVRENRGIIVNTETNTEEDEIEEEKEGWFEATQAFETLGFIAAIVALVLVILYIFVPQTSGKRIVFILGMLACFAAAGCIILGIIIYGSKIEHNLSWSFALCTIAGIIFGVSGILLVVDMLKR